MTVCLNNSAPSNSESGVSLGVFSFEDVSDSLSEIEGSVFLIVHVLDFQESVLLGLSSNSSSETSEYRLLVKSKSQK